MLGAADQQVGQIDVFIVVKQGRSVDPRAVQAVGAVNVRRLIAYASAAQVGCILVAIALESPAGLAAALVQLAAWGAGAFALLAGIAASRDAGYGRLASAMRTWLLIHNISERETPRIACVA